MAGDMAFDQEKARRLIAGAPDQGFMPESDSNEILTAYGLPMIRTQIAATEAQAARIAREMGYPVVMKLHSPDITHKTDAGGVRLDLRGDADVGQAYRQIVSSARAIQTRCPD
jgi:acetyltransferase